MASLLNNTRAIIRRRAAPNVPAKKTKINLVSSSDDRDPVTNIVASSSAKESNGNGEPGVKSNDISASVIINSSLSSQDTQPNCSTVIMDVSDSTLISDSAADKMLTDDVAQLVNETEVGLADTSSSASDIKVNDLVFNSLAPKKSEINSSVSEYKLLKKRCLPVLPKKRVLPKISCPSANSFEKKIETPIQSKEIIKTLDDPTGPFLASSKLDIAVKEESNKCSLRDTPTLGKEVNEEKCEHLESREKDMDNLNVVSFEKSVATPDNLMISHMTSNNDNCTSIEEIVVEEFKNKSNQTFKEEIDNKPVALVETNEKKISTLLLSTSLNIEENMVVEADKKDMMNTSGNFFVSGTATAQELEKPGENKKDLNSDQIIEQLSCRVNTTENKSDQPAAFEEIAEANNEEKKAEQCYKKVITKPLLAKRALPVLARKRPAPKLVQADNSVLRKDNICKKEDQINVCHNLSTCDGSNQKQLMISHDSSKVKEVLMKKQNLQQTNSSNDTQELEIESPVVVKKLLEDKNLEAQILLNSHGTKASPKNDCTLVENGSSSITEMHSSVKALSSTSENSKNKKVRFLLKKRAGPTIVSDKSIKLPKIKLNNMEIKSDLIKLDPYSSSHFQDLNDDSIKNVNKIPSTGSLEKTLNSTSEISETLKGSSASSCLMPTVSGSEKPETEGVVRVFLNCWPQCPQDELSEDPLCKDKKVEDLGKANVLSDKNPHVVYCDLKRTVDCKKIPENWVYVNFNKPITDEFSAPEKVEECGKSSHFSQEVQECSSALPEKSVSTSEPSHQTINSETSSDRFDSENNSNSVFVSPNKAAAGSNDNLKFHAGISDSLDISIPPDFLSDKISPLKDALSTDDCSGKQVVKSSDDDLSTPPDAIIKVVMIEQGNFDGNKDNDKLGSDEHDSPQKPYKFRLKKPQLKKTDDVLDDENKIEDIFSDCENSDSSEYIGKPEKKVKTLKVKKKLVEKKGAKKVGRPRKKAVEKKKEEKPKQKKEKQTKKKSEENWSAYKKLDLEVKNKNKWDEEGNCAEPEKLELKDFIFYVPKSVPMSQDVRKETNVNPGEEPEGENTKNSEDEEGENHGPKLIVKDGKIIIDPNSTKIKQTPIVHAKVEKFEKPKEPNDPWELQETMKFYATLWKYGIDFSMLAGTFPKKSRDSIKKKFNYEERNNGSLLTKTLTKKLDIQAVLRELILIDSLEKISRKKVSTNSKRSGEPKKITKKHCLLPKKKRVRNRQKEDIENTPANSNSPSLCDEESNQSMLSCISDNDLSLGEGGRTFDLKDVITFSTNLVYKDMNIIESVSIHPSAVQPLDINVTISHDPDDSSTLRPQPVALDTSLK